MSNWKITDPLRLAPIAAVALLAATSISLPSIADAQDTEASAEVALLSANELDSLVAPLALYPDDLVAIMLPASTYPIQVVEAQRFLQSRDEDDDLEPDSAWDDAIVALLNYPEALQLLNDDLDWTWQLGEAVLAQQADVLEAIESFRDEAFLAGNLASDEYQTVSREEDRIIIEPADPEVIYVPYYDPVEVVVRRPYRTYFYHDRGYPLYYYPYTVGHRFYRDPFFWGVSTAFSISWHNRFLHLNYFDTIRHPFYGHRYDSRRFFRHRFSRDYRVRNRHTGRFDRRGSHYRWYPNRFHGSRPGYSRNRTAQRQLTYNRNGYTRRSANNRQRFSRNGSVDNRQRLNRNARVENRQQRRTASDRRRNDAATTNRANSRFASRSRSDANDRRQRQNAVSTNNRSRLATANDRQRQARTRQRDTGARANDRRAENRARPTRVVPNRTTTVRRQEQRSVGGPTKRQSVDRSSQRSRFSSGDRSRSRATSNSRQRAAAPRVNRAPSQAQSRSSQSRPAQSRPQRESRPSRSSASRERSRASSSSRSRPSASRSRDRSSSKSRSRRRD